MNIYVLNTINSILAIGTYNNTSIILMPTNLQFLPSSTLFRTLQSQCLIVGRGANQAFTCLHRAKCHYKMSKLKLHCFWDCKTEHIGCMALIGCMDLCVELITMIRMGLWVLDTVHHAAFNNTVQCTSLHAPKEAFKTLWSTLPSTHSITLPVAHDDTLLACWTIHTRLCTQNTLKNAPKHTLNYTSNCTWWHTPSLFDYSLQSKLSGTLLRILSSTLPIALHDTFPFCLNRHSQVSSQDAPKYSLSTLPSTPPRMPQVHLQLCSQVPFWACSQGHSQLHSMAHSQPVWLYSPKEPFKILPTTLQVCSQVHQVRSQVHLQACSQGWSHSLSMAHSQSGRLYAPKCARNTLSSTLPITRWSTHSIALDDTSCLLRSMHPSTFSSGETLPNSLDCMIQYMYWSAWFRGLLGSRWPVPEGVRLVVSGRQCMVGGGRYEVSGGWQVACSMYWTKFWCQSILLSEPDYCHGHHNRIPQCLKVMVLTIAVLDFAEMDDNWISG